MYNVSQLALSASLNWKLLQSAFELPVTRK